MNLKKYTRADCRIRMPGVPSVNLRKSGPISFNKAVIEALGFKPNDKIVFVQDEQRPKDWFVAKADVEDGFVLREKTKSNNSMVTNSAVVVREVYKSVDFKGTSVTFRMATEPTEIEGEKYYAILTKVPSKNEK